MVTMFQLFKIIYALSNQKILVVHCNIDWLIDCRLTSSDECFSYISWQKQVLCTLSQEHEYISLNPGFYGAICSIHVWDFDCKKSMTISKCYPEAVNRRRTDNIMTKMEKNRRTYNDLQKQKTKDWATRTA